MEKNSCALMELLQKPEIAKLLQDLMKTVSKDSSTKEETATNPTVSQEEESEPITAETQETCPANPKPTEKPFEPTKADFLGKKTTYNRWHYYPTEVAEEGKLYVMRNRLVEAWNSVVLIGNRFPKYLEYVFTHVEKLGHKRISTRVYAPRDLHALAIMDMPVEDRVTAMQAWVKMHPPQKRKIYNGTFVDAE